MNERLRCLTVLGLAADATWETVKATHADLVQVWHPDRFAHNARLQDQAQEKLKTINAAFQWLKAHWNDPVNESQQPTKSARGPDANDRQPTTGERAKPAQQSRKPSSALRVFDKLYTTILILCVTVGSIATLGIWVVVGHDAHIYAQVAKAEWLEPPSDKVQLVDIKAGTTVDLSPADALARLRARTHRLPGDTCYLASKRSWDNHLELKYVESKSALAFIDEREKEIKETNGYAKPIQLSTPTQRNKVNSYEWIIAHKWGDLGQGSPQEAPLWFAGALLWFLPAACVIGVRKWLVWLAT